MKITIDRTARAAIYRQISAQIRNMITDGFLQPGFRLPSERNLAEFLAIDRQTVIYAYRELKTEGLIESFPDRRGTRVANQRKQTGITMAEKPNWNLLLTNRARNITDVNDDDLMLAVNRQDAISLIGRWTAFGGNWSDELPLPGGMERRIGSYDKGIASPVEGLLSFRKALSKMMFKSSGFCTPEKTIITRGGRHGLELVAQALINRGDIVLCEEPTYHLAKHVFKNAGAHLMGVPMTAEGMDLRQLNAQLGKYHVKFIFTQPTIHNPCGITTSLSHREGLLEISYAHGIPIVEDDPYWGMSYNSRPELPTLRSMDKGDHVVFIGTLSKAVTPRLGIGWICAPKKLLRALKAIMNVTIINSNTVAQLITQEFIETGAIYRHIDKLRDADLASNEIFREAMRKRRVPEHAWAHESEGPFRSIGLPPWIRATDLVKRASKNGVAVLPGTFFSIDPAAGETFIRISLRSVPAEQIVEGVNILGDTIEEMT